MSFIVYIKTENIYKDSADIAVETRFDTSNYELDRPLPKGKNKSNWINKRSIRQKNNNKICWITSKNL